MTVLDEDIPVSYPRNRVKDTLAHNDPIDTVLHVLMVVSNPCNFKRRYQLAHEFMQRMSQEKAIQLYVVELCYQDQPFVITRENEPRHLQLRTESPLWHKENMINCGTQMFPPDWKAMAWIDADIEFESPTWAQDCLKILNGYADIVQLFSHAVDMDKEEVAMNIATSAGFQYEKGIKNRIGVNYWHPGYAWACTRRAYDIMGGLYENAILGSGDNIMMCSLFGQVEQSIHEKNEKEYKKEVYAFQSKVSSLRFSYVPGVIRHYYHGSKVNRRYKERWQILVDHQYRPDLHLEKKDGLLIPSPHCPPKLLEDIRNYFQDRNEDE
jgi:hypothetical protein